MNVLVPFSLEDWDLICDPGWLCTLPFQATELGLTFDKDWVDGLGEVLYAYGAIAGKLILCESYVDASKDAGLVSVSILGQEIRWNEIITELCIVLGIQQSDLPFVQESLRPECWTLLRLEGNGSKIEIFSFPDKLRAEQGKREYERRGHQQTYFIQARN